MQMYVKLFECIGTCYTYAFVKEFIETQNKKTEMLHTNRKKLNLSIVLTHPNTVDAKKVLHLRMQLL